MNAKGSKSCADKLVIFLVNTPSMPSAESVNPGNCSIALLKQSDSLTSKYSVSFFLPSNTPICQIQEG